MIKQNIVAFFQLLKVTVTIPVTFLAFAGYVYFADHISVSVIPCCLAVFLLAGAASALNQVLEVKYDALMERTKNRPLPSGAIGRRNAIYLSLFLSIIGLWILLEYSIVSFITGVVTLAWYLGCYTLLKRVTAFAVIPGSLTGALPPIIGWTAAGGNFNDHRIFIISSIVFIWQIPHFWLLMLIYRDDYEKAGYPVLFNIFSEMQVRLWTLAWIIASGIAATISFVLLNAALHAEVILLFFIAFIAFAVFCLVIRPSKRLFKILFHVINFLMLALLAGLIW